MMTMLRSTGSDSAASVLTVSVTTALVMLTIIACMSTFLIDEAAAQAHHLPSQQNVNDWGDDEDEDVVSTVDVDAVLEHTATLPCDIEPESREDRVYMVLWFRENVGKPLYSFDVRGRAFGKALHTSDAAEFGQRAYFVTVSRPAALTLDAVTLSDAGIYRCRVDFKNSPSRNFQINLTVIVPPSNLFIYDRSGRDIVDTVGPLEEGTDLVLTCEVRGGRPPPTVSWFINDRLVEGRLLETGNNVIVNRLEVPRVRRTHLNSTFKCQASNTKLKLPFEKTVRLELLLRPLSVRMLHKPRQLIADNEYVITCEAVGSRPKAQITWSRENRKFRRGKIVEGGNETVVTSSVTFGPVPEDDGTILKCLGDNPSLPGTGIEDTILLNVVYPPQVALHLGSTLDPDAIKEGDDVYFECSIRANPKESKIIWFHNGVLVTQNMSSGIIISTHSLVLQKVTRHQSGAYTCLASNSRGETLSMPIFLRVRFAPVCYDGDTVSIIGATLDESLKVRCRVTADPSDISFTWQFNNSGEIFDVSPARSSTSAVATPYVNGNASVSSSGTSNANGVEQLMSVSELTYTVASEREYGTLACWGKNAVGGQARPCVFQVVPAAKPNPLRNCTLRSATNHSIDTLEVECVAGYDGGLPQVFILEAYESRTMRLRFNMTSPNPDTPLFRIELADLMPVVAAATTSLGDVSTPSPTLRIVLYAQNQKGKSDVTVLDDIALNDAEKRTDGSTTFSIVPLAALLTGVLLTLGIAVLLIVVLAVRRRRVPMLRPSNLSHCTHQLDIDPVKQQKMSPLQPSRQNSMLEINTGDHRYVVAYTLKPVDGLGGPGANCNRTDLNSIGPVTIKQSPSSQFHSHGQQYATLQSPYGACSAPSGGIVPGGGGVVPGYTHHQQPDILNAPPGTRAANAGSPQTPAPLPRPDALFTACIGGATPPQSLDVGPGYNQQQHIQQSNIINTSQGGIAPSTAANNSSMQYNAGSRTLNNIPTSMAGVPVNMAISTPDSTTSSPMGNVGTGNVGTIVTGGSSTLGRVRNRPRPQPYTSHMGTMRRDHIITDSIPGPESCV